MQLAYRLCSFTPDEMEPEQALQMVYKEVEI